MFGKVSNRLELVMAATSVGSTAPYGEGAMAVRHYRVIFRLALSGDVKTASRGSLMILTQMFRCSLVLLPTAGLGGPSRRQIVTHCDKLDPLLQQPAAGQSGGGQGARCRKPPGE